MTFGCFSLTITTSNINSLNSSFKRQRVFEWLKEQDKNICYLQETYFRYKDAHRLKIKDRKLHSMQIATKRKQMQPYLYQAKGMSSEKLSKDTRNDTI